MKAIQNKILFLFLVLGMPFQAAQGVEKCEKDVGYGYYVQPVTSANGLTVSKAGSKVEVRSSSNNDLVYSFNHGGKEEVRWAFFTTGGQQVVSATKNFIAIHHLKSSTVKIFDDVDEVSWVTPISDGMIIIEQDSPKSRYYWEILDLEKMQKTARFGWDLKNVKLLTTGLIAGLRDLETPRIYFINPMTGEIVKTFVVPLRAWTDDLDISNDGKYLAYFSRKNAFFQVIDMDSNTVMHQELLLPEGAHLAHDSTTGDPVRVRLKYGAGNYPQWKPYICILPKFGF